MSNICLSKRNGTFKLRIKLSKVIRATNREQICLIFFWNIIRRFVRVLKLHWWFMLTKKGDINPVHQIVSLYLISVMYGDRKIIMNCIKMTRQFLQNTSSCSPSIFAPIWMLYVDGYEEDGIPIIRNGIFEDILAANCECVWYVTFVCMWQMYFWRSIIIPFIVPVNNSSDWIIQYSYTLIK